MKPDGGHAFPKTGNFNQDQPADCDSRDQNGMSLRDYFAAKALPAVIEAGSKQKSVPVNHEIVAQTCYAIADAMIEERSKE